MAEYIEREALRDVLYEADAITMRGVAILNQFPAADVRPVVRARWEYNPGDNIPYCSECMMPQDSECNYCPNCGAMMEES